MGLRGGYDEDELVGQPATAVYYDPADRTWLASMQEQGVLRDLEVRFRHKDGSPVWVSINVAPLESGGTRAIIGVVQDVTARKRAEEALRESAERHAFLLRVSDALWPLADANEIRAVATGLLRAQFDAGWCYYIERADGVVAQDGAREGLPPLGNDPSDVSGLFRLLDAEQVLNVPDRAGFALLTPPLRKRYTALGVRSILGASVVKEGRPVALLLLADTVERRWSDGAVALVQDTAERTWAAVDRAPTQAAPR